MGLTLATTFTIHDDSLSRPMPLQTAIAPRTFGHAMSAFQRDRPKPRTPPRTVQDSNR